MAHYAKKLWFFVGIAIAIGVAFWCPVVGQMFHRWHVMKAAIFVAFLITGLTLETKAIVDEIRNLKAVAAALVSCFVLFPLVAFVLGKVCFSGNMDVVVGLCILGVVPATVASGTVLTQIARGNVPLSLFICVATSLIGIFTVPVSLQVLLQSDQTIDLPVLRMIRSLVLVALLPTIIGQLLRIKIKDVIAAWRRVFSIFSQLVILLIIFNAVSKSTAQIMQLGLAIVFIFLFTVLLHTIMLAANFGIAKTVRLDRPSTAAFTIHTSQKTLTVSFVVWDLYFATLFPLAMIPIIAHHLTQLLIDTVVAGRFKKAHIRD